MHARARRSLLWLSSLAACAEPSGGTVSVAPIAPIESAQRIVPTPRSVTYSNQALPLSDGDGPTACLLVGAAAPAPELEAAHLIHDITMRLGGSPLPVVDDLAVAGCPLVISIGSTGSNPLSRALLAGADLEPPDHPEGYLIRELDHDGRPVFVLAGREAIGSFYAAASFVQMLVDQDGVIGVRRHEVTDWPELSIRAVKDIDNFEGHFAFADSIEWAALTPYGKANVFSPCYTHLRDWRAPSDAYARAIKDLANDARARGLIHLMQEVNPGYTGGLPVGSADWRRLIDDFRLSLDEGGSMILAAYDDQGSTDPALHRDLSNALSAALGGQDGFRMVTAPQAYNFTYANVAPYLAAFTDGLDLMADAVWTGDDVFSNAVTAAHVQTWLGYAGGTDDRRPFFWHNDALLASTRVHLDPAPPTYYFPDRRVPFQTTDLPASIFPRIRAHSSGGVLLNVFRQWTAHKLYFLAYADWMWNPGAYTNDGQTFDRVRRYWDTVVANPAFGRPTAASSSTPGYGPALAVDGLVGRHDPEQDDHRENAWATAAGGAVDSWWSVDLGHRQDLTAVDVRFRQLGGRAYAVPKSVTIEVSDDGASWRPVVDRSVRVPQLGAAYNAQPVRYRFDARARHLRLRFPDGSQGSGADALVELTEVEAVRQRPIVPRAVNPVSRAAAPSAASGEPARANDGVVEGDGQLGWAASDAGPGAWWQLDFGAPIDLDGVGVHFHRQAGLAAGVPRSITYQVSDDGHGWTTILARSSYVPLEGRPYDGRALGDDVRGRGRFLRLLFEDGGQAGGLGLAEVTAYSRDLALRRPATASSTAGPAFAAARAVDGTFSRRQPENAWASAPGQDVGAWLEVDLGQVADLRAVHVRYREFPADVAAYLPRTVTIQARAEGGGWTTLIARSANVPREGAPYSSQPRSYAVEGRGRFVRLLFEDGAQDTATGLVEVSEVEVTSVELPRHQRQTRDLAFKKRATASSTFGPDHAAERANDGERSGDRPENAWAAASAAPGQWWQVDLGAPAAIGQVALVFREWPIGRAYAVPTSVTIQVSDDGVAWQTALSRSTAVPDEGAAYASEARRYAVDRTARFVRLLFEDGGQGELIELSEVEVTR